jgi:hypothetical protein
MYIMNADPEVRGRCLSSALYMKLVRKEDQHKLCFTAHLFGIVENLLVS